MKKKIILVVFIASLFIAYFFFVNAYDAKTIEEALDIDDHLSFETIHSEVLEESTLVFSIINESSLHTAVVREVLGRYKTVYSGVYGDIEKTSRILGVTDTYFPGVKGISKPLLFGMIGDPEISKLTIVNAETELVREVEIISSKGYRLWQETLESSETSDYSLIAYNEKGEEVVRRSVKFTPREIINHY